MNLKDAVNEINGMEYGDPEQDHPAAEEILCKYLKANGAQELAEAFESAVVRCDFWYA